ncbi:MAG: bifunctional glutamate N-acetyltransferase/amino-acid acetyltransferase ArgJ [Candidatus Ancillula sp.]|jgi:glutamate N-acetyltransferase/amino-acid N-acetyltransferase|nr:bifunctional glutamate N-acetyltransferase/amino-acid acetyltransferase ArgJ [Candidatus Ancillula sp.]
MSVTYADGFRAAGITAGLKPSGKPDLALIVNDGPAHSVAATLTPNRASAAPVNYTKRILDTPTPSARAVLVNSGSANACTGKTGEKNATLSAEAVAKALGVQSEEVLLASTGKIAVHLNMPAMLKGVEDITPKLSANAQAGVDASDAICTTDTHSKRAQIEGDGYKIGGMVKGAGMIAPAMATMIAVVTTDADASSADLQTALNAAVDMSFNRIDSDGCMSTNDTVILMASGASKTTPDLDEFTANLTTVLKSLARQIINDAEGASHDILIRVQNATSEGAALAVAREVSRSNLLKCALFGGDPNWGRVLASMGVVPESVAPYKMTQVDVKINGVQVCRGGSIGDDASEVDFTEREIVIEIDLKAGVFEAELWTNDLTYEYVKENAEYST